MTLRRPQSPLRVTTSVVDIYMAVEMKIEGGEPNQRPVVPYSSLPELSKGFFIDPSKRSFKHQYSNIYFVRLVELRPIVEEHAKQLWGALPCTLQELQLD